MLTESLINCTSQTSNRGYAGISFFYIWDTLYANVPYPYMKRLDVATLWRRHLICFIWTYINYADGLNHLHIYIYMNLSKLCRWIKSSAQIDMNLNKLCRWIKSSAQIDMNLYKLCRWIKSSAQIYMNL